MRAKTNLNSFGKKSLILPSNPEITKIKSLNRALAIQWKDQITEIGIAHYNIYILDEKPETLRDMILVGNTSKLEFVVEGLDNNKTYFVAVESVSVQGFENASMQQIKSGTPFDTRFLAIGETNSYYTTDAENWINMNGIITGNAITHGDGRYVVVGNNGKAFYSLNCFDWIEMSGIDINDNIVAVTYGNGKFVCISQNGSSYCSDGETWVKASGTKATSEYYHYNYYEIVYVGGEFFAQYWYYGPLGDISTSYYFGTKKSADGKTWTGCTEAYDRNSSDKYKKHYAFGDNRIIYVYEGSNTEKAYTSVSGKTNKMVGMPPEFVCRDIAYGDGRFIAVGYGKAYYTVDCENWIEMSGIDKNDNMIAVTYGNGMFVAIGNNSYCTVDGKTWNIMNGLDTACTCIISNDWNNKEVGMYEYLSR